MSKPDFWNDLDKSQQTSQRIKVLRNRIQQFKDISGRWDDLYTLVELGLEEEQLDQQLMEEIDRDMAAFKKELEGVKISTLLSGPYDGNNAIVSLHAGAGGTEAQDWAQMLYRMYTRWCEDKGYTVNVLDFLEGDEAGIKSVTILVTGINAYGYLKAEKGVHRLVRISPFDASGRRHTSFASVDVMPEISEDVDVDINPEDLRIDTYRSGGAGGQHVNKTDSAVRITHIPTGIVVQCQNERSQHSNKESAMKVLRSKLIELKERENLEKISELKGEMKRIEWGSQIRSYVFHPYNMVKDHRTNAETGNTTAVMDGDIDLFINEYLKHNLV
jgi:peptide chain release factor 2